MVGQTSKCGRVRDFGTRGSENAQTPLKSKNPDLMKPPPTGQDRFHLVQVDQLKACFCANTGITMSSDASQLGNLLAVLTQPDTEAIRQAETALKPLLKDPRCVPALVEILKAKDVQVGSILLEGCV